MDLSCLGHDINNFQINFLGHCKSTCNQNLLNIIQERLADHFDGEVIVDIFEDSLLRMCVILNPKNPTSEHFLSLINSSESILKNVFLHTIIWSIDMRFNDPSGVSYIKLIARDTSFNMSHQNFVKRISPPFFGLVCTRVSPLFIK